MTTKKLKLVDRALTRIAYGFDELGGLIKSRRCCEVSMTIIEHIVDKYVEREVRATGKMHCCVSFDEIHY